MKTKLSLLIIAALSFVVGFIYIQFSIWQILGVSIITGLIGGLVIKYINVR